MQPPEAGVVATFNITVGAFQPALRDTPEQFGGTFKFVARDADGLPVVGEYFEGSPRTDSFKAELQVLERDSPRPLSEQLANRTMLSTLAVQFIGNKALQADGTWSQVVTPGCTSALSQTLPHCCSSYVRGHANPDPWLRFAEGRALESVRGQLRTMV